MFNQQTKSSLIKSSTALTTVGTVNETARTDSYSLVALTAAASLVLFLKHHFVKKQKVLVFEIEGEGSQGNDQKYSC
jgi:hypothetical protein